MKIKIAFIAVVALMMMIGMVFQSCETEDENVAPTASFTVTPNSGNTETLFVFDASASADPEDSTSQLVVRWDLDGDGNWESDWAIEKSINKKYALAGTYNAILEVKDTEGMTGQSSNSISVTDNGGGGLTGTINDPRDGKTYATIEIGSQTWISENLNFETADSWWHGDDPSNGTKYGRLYTWESAKAACPAGWHLPSDTEWKQLEMALGMSQSEADGEGYRGTDEGSKLKATSGWEESGHGTNSSGFSALPAGFRLVDGSYSLTGWDAWWWSSTEYDSNGAWNRSLGYSYDQIERDEDHKMGGLSVRCVKD